MKEETRKATQVLWVTKDEYHYVCDACYAYHNIADWTPYLDDLQEDQSKVYERIRHNEIDCQICSTNSDEIHDISEEIWQKQLEFHREVLDERREKVQESFQKAKKALEEERQAIERYLETQPSSISEAIEQTVNKEFAKRYAKVVADHRRTTNRELRDWSVSVAGEGASIVVPGLGLVIEALDALHERRQHQSDVERLRENYYDKIVAFQEQLGDDCKRRLGIDDDVVSDKKLGRHILATIIDHHRALEQFDDEGSDPPMSLP